MNVYNWMTTLVAQAIPPAQAPTGFVPITNRIVGNLRWGVPIAGLVAVLIGLVMWAIGSFQSDSRTAMYGKKGMVAGSVTAIVAGAFGAIWTTVVG